MDEQKTQPSAAAGLYDSTGELLPEPSMSCDSVGLVSHVHLGSGLQVSAGTWHLSVTFKADQSDAASGGRRQLMTSFDPKHGTNKPHIF